LTGRMGARESPPSALPYGCGKAEESSHLGRKYSLALKDG
jgi:hypothetical protein